MSNVPKCLLKINKKLFEEKQPELKQKEESISKPIAEQKEPEQQEEEELSFNDFVMEEEQEQEKQQDEEYIKQQKKIGLMCYCDLTTILREVKKDGLNKGKMFYTCSKSYDDKCNYFMWKDESDKKRGQNIKANKEPIKELNKEPIKELNEEPIEEPEEKEEHDEKYYKQQQKMGLMCYCKLPSISREVKKDGANKGKIFYTCPRYFDDKCKYFVWKDEIKK
jgi:DNA topoisomerase-3